MRLKVFDTIDEALALLSENNEFYHEIEREIEQYLIAVFKESSEMIIDINSRVKSRESLREKIIRNRFYVENDSCLLYTSFHTPIAPHDRSRRYGLPLQPPPYNAL